MSFIWESRRRGMLGLPSSAPPEPPPEPEPPATAAEIDAALTGTLTGVVAYDYAFEIRTKKNLFVRDDARFVQNKGYIDLNNDRSTVRTARIYYEPDPDVEDIDPNVDIVAILMNLNVPRLKPDGSYVNIPTTIQMGLFQMEVGRQTFTPTGVDEEWSIDCSDMKGLLQQERFEDPYTIFTDDNPITVIESIVAGEGLAHAFEQTTLTMPVDKTWPPNTRKAVVIDEILQSINFYPAYATRTGIIRSRERVPFETEPVVITYTETGWVIPPFIQSKDFSAFANQYTVVINDPDRSPDWVKRRNNDTVDSDIAYDTIGAVSQTIEGQLINNIDVAQEIADHMLEIQSTKSENIELKTVPDPRREPHEIINFDITELADEHSDHTFCTWRVARWRLPLVIGESMTHEAGHVTGIDLSTVVGVDISGSATSAITETDVVTGGKVLLVELIKGTWSVTWGLTEQNALAAGITGSTSGAGSWDDEVSIPAASVVRTSDTIVTVTLPASAGYDITALDTITVEVPDSLVVGDIGTTSEVGNSPIFTVSEV